ncbi:oral-facial-digital syndrome 1 protein isoform X1 [Oryzias latipes]|uniref:OFD1 centriole and centriolar satellite protein n=1 Tax=Oryzias latipes TaxID=8090 RepID=A0A3B3HAB4_ORYLA|nr:oral-facial-digital syndrome 1 protein isoform X1 [Oryzias latipes]
MSTSKEVEAFSSDELRKRLYQTFKSKGFLDSLKAQLRNQLIQELKHPPLTGQEPVPRLVPLKTDTLLASACNSIVADHLQASGYEYTLSVFCPESGLNKDKVLKKDDLLQILKINPESKLYKSVACKENDNKGFLFNLLTHLTSHNAPSPRQDADAQTTTASNYGESLVEKMKTIDKEYEHFNKDQMFSFQSKLAAYKREIETQMEASMNVKLHHFKEVEMAKVRLEEKSKFHKEFDNLKRELERNYEMKAKALMEREKNAIEGLQKHKEIEEKDMYMQRQSTLKDIESLRYRENELRMRMEAFEKTCQIHAEKVKTAEELLRRRELAVKTMEDTYEQKLKNELSSYQLELKEEFIKRTEKLTENENRNRVEAARIQQESAALNARSEEHSRTCAKLKQLQADLDTAQQQISLLTQQKDLLRERLESTSDYPSLRRERTELQEQMQLLKKQLEEVREENRRLHAEMATPSKEQLALQVELQRLQNARRLDEEDFDNQREVLQAQLQNESDRCAQLKAQLLDHQERAQWMNSHVEELKMKLRHTQQALENEVLRNPKPSLVDRSVLEFSPDKLVPPDIYVDRGLLGARPGYHDDWKTAGTSQGHKTPWYDSHDPDMELVAVAKTRLQELQKEAESLEEAYRSYQQRAVPSISHRLSPKPFLLQQARPSHHNNPHRGQQDSHHSHKSKSPFTPHSPQRVLSSILVFDDPGSPAPAPQPRLTSLDDYNQLHRAVPRHQSLAEPLFMRAEQPQDESVVSSEHSSCRSQSSTKKKLHKKRAEEAVVSPAVSPQPLCDGSFKRAPAATAAAADFSPEISPPHSPQLKSTARDQSSPLESRPVFSSSESSPQPEKIKLEDLTEVLESSHIPELLLDTAGSHSEKAPDGPSTAHPQDLPEDPGDSEAREGSPNMPQTLGESARVQEEDVEEQRWEKERKDQQEKREGELEEAKEREQQELERLEKEMLLQNVEQLEKESEVDKEEDDGQKKEADQSREESKVENPLEKYMKMVLEAREKRREESPQREEAGQTSPENISFNDDTEQSAALHSPKEMEDDFW